MKSKEHTIKLNQTLLLEEGRLAITFSHSSGNIFDFKIGYIGYPTTKICVHVGDYYRFPSIDRRLHYELRVLSFTGGSPESVSLLLTDFTERDELTEIQKQPEFHGVRIDKPRQ